MLLFTLNSPRHVMFQIKPQHYPTHQLCQLLWCVPHSCILCLPRQGTTGCEESKLWTSRRVISTSPKQIIEEQDWLLFFCKLWIPQKHLTRIHQPRQQNPLVPDYWTQLSRHTRDTGSLACEQALHLGDIVKSRQVRSMQEETRKQGSWAAHFAHPNRKACVQATAHQFQNCHMLLS